MLLTTVSSGLRAQVGLYADGSIFEKLLDEERRGDVGRGPAGVSAGLLLTERRLQSELFSLDKPLQFTQTGFLQ